MSLDDTVRAIVREEIAAALKGVAAPAAPAAAPKPRGRPAKGGGDSPAPVATTAQAPAQPVAAATQPEADPFAPTAPVAAPAPAASLQDVRDALTALRAATTQENALKVLKDASGVDNLTALVPEKYGVVVAAAKAAVPAAPQQTEADPFDTTPAAPAAKPATLEDVKAACVEGAKRTSQDTVLKVIFEHGGKAPLPTGGEGASLKALPEAAFGKVIAAIKALPSTK